MIQVDHGDKGWQFTTQNERFQLQIDSRLQFRYAYPFDTDPLTFDDFNAADQHVFKVNRARLKIGGHGYQKWLKYYWEYELASGNLLDFRIMIEKWPWLKFKFGQWKAQYNRERIISSGKQQMVDRSLINRYFTIDRQQGISLFGRYQGRGLLDISYWFEILTGMGRGATANDDTKLMYMLRTQWNIMGKLIKFSGSDLAYTEELSGLLALGFVTNQSPYTRFSQNGGGQLDGFGAGEAGQYRVHQAMLETVVLYCGFSWQQELHWKEIHDRLAKSKTTLLGNYLQIGYFFNTLWDWVPEDLEIALRHAVYNPNRNISADLKQEFSLMGNWFFNKHRNKLSAELSLFDFQKTPTEEQDGARFRVQWDISI